MCMIGAWGDVDGTPGPPDPVCHPPNSQRVPRREYNPEYDSTKFKWLDPPPGGWYGKGFCPERAGELLAPIELEMAQDWGGIHPGGGGHGMLMRDWPNFGMP